MLSVERVLRADWGLIGNAAGIRDYHIHADCSIRSLVIDDGYEVASFETNIICASSDELPCPGSYMGPRCSSRVGMQPPQRLLVSHSVPKLHLGILS